MTRQENHDIKLSKIHSKPKKGYKLGTTSATWKKIKLATYGTVTLQDEAEEVKPIVRNDDNGNILQLYPADWVLELWTWNSPSPETQIDNSGDSLFISLSRVITFNDLDLSEVASDVLLVSFYFICGTVVLLQFTDGCVTRFFTFDFLNNVYNELYALPDVMQTESARETAALTAATTKKFAFQQFEVKSNGNYIIISNEDGYMVIYQKVPNEAVFYPLQNLANIYKESCQPLINKFNSSSNSMVLKTSCFDNTPIFDIVGDWLVYSPTKYEYRYLKSLAEYGNLTNSSTRVEVSRSNGSTFSSSTLSDSSSNTLVPSNRENGASRKSAKKASLLTQVKLPPPGPLLNQVISSISNTALDGLCKISEISSTAVKNYYKGSNSASTKANEPTSAAKLNEFTKNVTKAIYSTAASTIASSKPDNNQLIKIIDLKNDKVMGIFKPPGGVSNVSLSPYDLQLVHSNLRGDLVFMWDLYKLPLEVSLIGKFIRGKTSATIGNIFWFINNNQKGNNYGFGCITKSSGSVHWYNINYLSGSLNNNLPNVLGKAHKTKSSKRNAFNNVKSNASDEFSDEWILSSMKACNYVTLPTKSNSMNSNSHKHPNDINQLAIIDSKQQLRLISPLNGLSLFKYQLPLTNVESESVPKVKRLAELLELMTIDEDCFKEKKEDHINPLSRSEIETCGPYHNLYRNKNVEFAIFNCKEGQTSDLEAFLSNYEDFGEEIDHRVISFTNKEDVMGDGSGIVLDQEANEEGFDDSLTVVDQEN